MLRRHLRLRRRRDIKQLHSRSRVSRHQYFSVKVAPNNLDHPRAMVIVSTKISKQAVTRNRLRRRLHGCLQSIWPQLLPGQDIMVILHLDLAKVTPAELESALLKCLGELKAITTVSPV